MAEIKEIPQDELTRDLEPAAASPVLTALQGNWWWRLALAGAMAILLGLGALRLIGLLARPLAILIVGIALAAALAPVVAWLARWLPRVVAVIFVYLVITLLFAGLLWYMIPQLAGEVQRAAEQLPALLDQGQNQVQQLQDSLGVDLVSDGTNLSAQLGSLGLSLTQIPQQIMRYGLDILLIIFTSIYALTALPSARDFLLSLLPADGSRQRAREVLGRTAEAMGGYVRGTLIDSFIVGILTYIGLLVIGIDFALPLAVFSGVMEIIPNLGPVISAIVMVGFALLQSPSKALIVLIFAIVLQQLENHLLVPNIMNREASISPLVALLAVAAGYFVMGLLGVLAAIPLVAALRVLILELLVPEIRAWTGAKSEVGAESSG